MSRSIQAREDLPLIADYDRRIILVGKKEVPFEGCVWWEPEPLARAELAMRLINAGMLNVSELEPVSRAAMVEELLNPKDAQGNPLPPRITKELARKMLGVADVEETSPPKLTPVPAAPRRDSRGKVR